jgi:hypothetical protein
VLVALVIRLTFWFQQSTGAAGVIQTAHSQPEIFWLKNVSGGAECGGFDQHTYSDQIKSAYFAVFDLLSNVEPSIL